MVFNRKWLASWLEDGGIGLIVLAAIGVCVWIYVEAFIEGFSRWF